MRPFFALFFSAVLLGQNINFPDANFKAYLIGHTWTDQDGVEVPYDSNSDGEISIEEATAVTGAMFCQHQDIEDLSGIEHFVNLPILWASSNRISSVLSLATMTQLTMLNLSVNQLIEIDALANLVDLNFLGLGLNEIQDISALANLRALEDLIIVGTPLSNLTPLSSLTTLTELNLGWNQIGDISPLAGLVNLRKLFLEGNQIVDIAALGSLTRLERLWVHTNRIENIESLAALSNLSELDIRNNTISDISALVGLSHLTLLSASSNAISDPSAVGSMTLLEELYLSENQISDISPLASLNRLTILSLYKNQIENVQALASLVNLSRLFLNNNRIRDIDALAAMVNLDILYLYDNSITDITAIADLQNLTWLKLSHNPVADISPLANLQNLQLVSLGHLALSDISTLAGLVNLEMLYLHNNQISDVAPLAGLSKLEVIDLNDNLVENVSPLLAINTAAFHEIDLNFNLFDSIDCTHLLTLEDKCTNFFYHQQKNEFIDCAAGVESPKASLSAPNFVTSDRIWINEAGTVVVNLPHPNIDGWDATTEIDLRYVLTLVQNGVPVVEMLVSDDTAFPKLTELGAAPNGDYFVSIKRKAVVDGGGNETIESQPILIPGPRRIYGQQIAPDYSFINRWLFHMPKKIGGFDARVTLTNRFPELPAKVRLIAFDSQGQPVNKADKELIVIGRRVEWLVYGDTPECLFFSDLQDDISHVGIFEPNDKKLVMVSLTYVNLESGARSNTSEINLSHGKGGSKFLLVPTGTQVGDTKWDGIAALNMRNDTETAVWLDQAVTQIDDSTGTSREIILQTAFLGSIPPGGKLLYAISQTEFPFVGAAYFLLRTQDPSQKIQALALHGGPGFLAVNNELLLLE